MLRSSMVGVAVVGLTLGIALFAPSYARAQDGYSQRTIGRTTIHGVRLHVYEDCQTLNGRTSCGSAMFHARNNSGKDLCVRIEGYRMQYLANGASTFLSGPNGRSAINGNLIVRDANPGDQCNN